MTKFSIFNGVLAAMCIALLAAFPTLPVAAEEAEDVWPGLSEDVFGSNATFIEEDGMVELEAPYRAEDAALVPLTIRIPAKVAPKTKKLVLIIEKNPAPVVATFNYGPAAGLGERVINTRVRINMYSNVRAIIETDDGKLHMTTKFVKASGGCSAPGLKDMEQALANMGKMKLKFMTAPQQSKPPSKEAQIMIRHPNYTGMQWHSQKTYFIPAKFIEHMEVRKGEDIIFTMKGGISISEDPNFRFTYSATHTGPLVVTAKDTEGNVFEKTLEEAGS